MRGKMEKNKITNNSKTNHEQRKYRLWLHCIEGISDTKKRRLMDFFEAPREIYESDEKRLLLSGLLTEEDIQLLTKSKKYIDMEKQLEYMEKNNTSYFFEDDNEYPEKLKNIQAPPYCLFVKGHLPKESRAVAVIGARACSNYGRQLARKIGMDMAAQGVAVIGGMARGIDTYGHRGALDIGGASYAVLGCGIDICYPSENIEIYEEMAQKGGIISELPLGSMPKSWNFPRRNRIISGLSDLVIVVEAKKKSGSLITAEYALNQGADVMAVPGRVTDALSEGCNHLIRDGAYVFTAVEDIGDLLKINTVKKNEILNKVLEKDFEVVYSKTDLVPVSLQELADKTGFDTGKILEIILKLQLEGLIYEPAKNYYARKGI